MLSLKHHFVQESSGLEEAMEEDVCWGSWPTEVGHTPSYRPPRYHLCAYLQQVSDIGWNINKQIRELIVIC